MKPKLIVSVGKHHIDQNAPRGNVGHRPLVGDYSQKEIYLNNHLIYTKIGGKEQNRYSGKYQSYTKANSDNDHDAIKQRIVEVIGIIEANDNILITKRKKSLASQIFDNSYYSNSDDDFSIRKSKEYLGAKVVFKGDFYM